MSGLLELAPACEKAAGPIRELDEAIFALLPFADLPKKIAGIARYTASLDAAMTLVPEGWFIGRLNDSPHLDRAHVMLHSGIAPFADAEGHGSTRALALCAAALRARAQTPSNSHE